MNMYYSKGEFNEFKELASQEISLPSILGSPLSPRRSYNRANIE